MKVEKGNLGPCELEIQRYTKKSLLRGLCLYVFLQLFYLIKDPLHQHGYLGSTRSVTSVYESGSQQNKFQVNIYLSVYYTISNYPRKQLSPKLDFLVNWTPL